MIAYKRPATYGTHIADYEHTETLLRERLIHRNRVVAVPCVTAPIFVAVEYLCPTTKVFKSPSRTFQLRQQQNFPNYGKQASTWQLAYSVVSDTWVGPDCEQTFYLLEKKHRTVWN